MGGFIHAPHYSIELYASACKNVWKWMSLLHNSDFDERPLKRPNRYARFAHLHPPSLARSLGSTLDRRRPTLDRPLNRDLSTDLSTDLAVDPRLTLGRHR
eukprot:1807878-Prymnesium_polylepis.1